MPIRTRQVLVVEDDFLQAMDIEHFLNMSGAHVLGPVASIEEGMKFADAADAAVLDITLKDCLVFPLADKLAKLGTPFVFYTGLSDCDSVPSRFRHIQIIRKPMQTLPEAAVFALTASPASQTDDVETLLPKLRLAARLMYFDVATSDRLVERVLKDAIAHSARGQTIGPGAESARWLLARMRSIQEENGRELMN